MSKSKLVRVGMLLASGATMMAWGCTNWWWWAGLAADAAISYTVGTLAAP